METMIVRVDPAKSFVNDYFKGLPGPPGYRHIRITSTLKTDYKFKAGKHTLNLVKFLRTGENEITGKALIRRAKKLGVCGQKHMEVMYQNKNLIPKSWRKFILIFPGTIWQEQDTKDYFMTTLSYIRSWQVGDTFIYDAFDGLMMTGSSSFDDQYRFVCTV